MERWVEYDETFFNMANVTHFYQSGNGIIVCFTHKEKAQDRLRLNMETDDVNFYRETISDIIRGEYNVPTGTRICSESADAQASASLEDVQKAIDDDDLPF